MTPLSITKALKTPLGRAGRALAVALLALSGFAAAAPAGDTRVVFPESVSQGAMVVGKVPPGSEVDYAGRRLRVTGYGSVVFGVGRDAVGPLQVQVRLPDGSARSASIAVSARDWPVERVSGVPPRTVAPPPEVAARIAREAALVSAARSADDDRADFARAFIWPVQGRISGRFGNQRIYNGSPGSPHSGMDIAAPEFAGVVAPAAGIVTLAEPDLYITGGTVIIDHGHGISSNFLHLSQLSVEVGRRVQQGEMIGKVGATGRATGPHLHWGMNWFDVRIDPLLVLEKAKLAERSPVIKLDGPHLVLQAALEAKPRPERLDYFAATLRNCLAIEGRTLDTTTVRQNILVLREKGAEIELVMPDEIAAFVFWPGHKPGQPVRYRDVRGKPGVIARELSEMYFEGPRCNAMG
jgi:hypothetical protein